MQFRMIRSIAVAVGLVAVISGNVSAQVITHQFVFGERSTTWLEIVNLPMFDSALGTLDQVDFEMSYSGSIMATFEAILTDAHLLNSRWSADLEVFAYEGFNTLLFRHEQAFQPDTGPYFLGKGNTRSFGPDPFSRTYSTSLTGADADKYIGLGAATVQIFAGWSTFMQRDVAYQETFPLLTTQSTIAATVTWTYRYTPRNVDVPEPGALAMLIGMGAAGLVALRRRRA